MKSPWLIPSGGISAQHRTAEFPAGKYDACGDDGKCRHTRGLFEGKRVACFANIATVATRKLQLPHSAVTLDALHAPSANRLEALRADRKEQYSIRVYDPFRLCFTWQAGDAFDVEIVDYH
jgi:toxin HigB-1